MPFVFVNQAGESWIGEGNDDLLALSMKTKFNAVDQIWDKLDELPMGIYEQWEKVLEPSRQINLLSNSDNGLNYCHQYREQGFHDNQAFRDQIVMAYIRLPKLVLNNA